MRISILPKSTLGWWSIGLGLAYILFFVLSEVMLGPGPDYNMALAIALTILNTCIAAGAFLTGLISIIKSKERAIFVFSTTAIGLYGLIGGIGSLLGLA